MSLQTYKEVNSQPENPLSTLVRDQQIAIIPSYTLESGTTLTQIPISYKTWGTLNASGDNVMVICHALTGSADVEDWWGPLLGPKKAFDTEKFFIFCANVLGSPYGSASPLTNNPDSGKPYWNEFPDTSIRDDVRLHRLVLEDLGVKQVAICIGGSLGGMQVLEWAMFGSEFVKNVIPIATSGKHSAWGISWGEAQRQSIYSDPNYCGGKYTFDKPPNSGLAAARMSALLTYRSRNSFESRFGRNKQTKKNNQTPPSEDPQPTSNSLFSAQSYLRYQGDKFVGRFDANCYIAITKKMDSHDLSRSRGEFHEILSNISQPALVVGIESDGLFTISEQYELAEFIPNSKMVEIKSEDGHDGFLLEFQQINEHIKTFIKEHLPVYYQPNGNDNDGFKSEKSLFGEAEGDITEW